MSKRTLKEIASDFGAEHRALHHNLKAAVASAKPEALAEQEQVRQIPVPQGAHVEVTIPGFGVSSQVILNHVLQPQSSTYVLDLQDGPNNLAWLVTPVEAPWAFEVDLTIRPFPAQSLDKGAGSSTGDPIFGQVQLNVG